MTNEKLLQIKQTLLCNAKLDCDNIKTIFTNHTRNVIVIHFDFKQLTSYADSFNKWSYCGIRTVIVDGHNNNNNNNTIINLSQICSKNKNTIVLTLTNSSVDFFQVQLLRKLEKIGTILE